MDYTIVAHTELAPYFQDGWVPVGGPVFKGGRWYVALVKYGNPLKEDTHEEASIDPAHR